MTEIGDTPTHLSRLIVLVTERQNCMIVGLRNRIAMPTVPGGAQGIGRDDTAVSLDVMLLQPGKQRWSKIKTYMLVVIYDLLCTADDNPELAIRLVTLRVDAFVPIVKRQRAGFRIDYSCPGVLAWWLIEVAVDY
jgi:hypothetical protein